MMRIVAYVPDLMDRSRISAVAGSSVEFVTIPAALMGSAADVVVVDLGRPGVLDVLPNVAARTIGFGSHIDRDLLEAARAAGCGQVLTRSVFFARLGELLNGS